MTHYQSLIPVRRALLDLHKALIQRERAEYESAHGSVSPGEMLQLLISDDRFSWLHPISALIVRIDELIGNADTRRRPNPVRPAMAPDQVMAETLALLVETRALLTSGDAPGGFRDHYTTALTLDPAIVLMHQAVVASLPRDPVA